MKREILITSDGSTTIHLPDWNEQYHSKHGAIQEAYHVFIKNGLDKVKQDSVSILEIGFGTGLNSFITFLEATKKGLEVLYTGVEAYPVLPKELEQLNYVSELKATNFTTIFDKLHTSEWGKEQLLSASFKLYKRQELIQEVSDENLYDLIYFDAFGAEHQPELWTAVIFKKMITALKLNGILVTYSAKGSVRRAMEEVGFKVERLPGPPGKREMLRAKKIAITIQRS